MFKPNRSVFRQVRVKPAKTGTEMVLFPRDGYGKKNVFPWKTPYIAYNNQQICSGFDFVFSLWQPAPLLRFLDRRRNRSRDDILIQLNWLVSHRQGFEVCFEAVYSLFPNSRTIVRFKVPGSCILLPFEFDGFLADENVQIFSRMMTFCHLQIDLKKI